MHERAEFAVADELDWRSVDDFFAENFHCIGGVEAAVFALGAVKDDSDVFDLAVKSLPLLEFEAVFAD